METDFIFQSDAGDALGSDSVQIATLDAASEAADALPTPLDSARVVIPEGQNVVHLAVTPGEVVELPFGADAHVLAAIGNGNLAIKVGDILVILEGYVAAAGETPPVIETADGKPLDIAAILAATDPGIEIETAAGPGGNQGEQGADNTGALFQQLGEGQGGLGGSTAVGGQDDSQAPDGAPGVTVPGGPLLRTSNAESGPVNVAPFWTSGTTEITFHEDESGAVRNLVFNVTDPDDSVFTITPPASLPTGFAYDPATGILTGNPAGHYENLAAGQSAKFTLTFEFSDGKASTTHDIALTVEGRNDPATLSDPGGNGFQAWVTENSGIAATGKIDIADLDDGEALLQGAGTIVGKYGTLVLQADGNWSYTLDDSNPEVDARGSMVWSPALEDTFTITSKDGTASATLTVSVSGVNDPPRAADDAYSTDEDTPLLIKASDLLANDLDPEGEAISIFETLNPGNGTLIGNGNGTYTYVPNANFSGIDTIAYKLFSFGWTSDWATVTIDVKPANDAPVGVADAYATDQDAPLTIALADGVLANDVDVDNDSLTASLVSGPANGALAFNDDGTFTYTAKAGYNGADSFTYQVNDGELNSSPTTVHIEVGNTAPVAVADSVVVNEGATATTLASGADSLLANDTDPNNDALTVSVVTGPAHGTLDLKPDGTFTYTHDGSETLSDSFTYWANDGKLDGNVTTVSITVNPVNDAPIANADSYTVTQGMTLTVGLADGVLANDTDAEHDPLTVQYWSTFGLHGSITTNADGTFVYTPYSDFSGTESFWYAVWDQGKLAAGASITITVNANQAPLPGGDFVLTNAGSAAFDIPTWALLANDTDPDSPSESLRITNAWNIQSTLDQVSLDTVNTPHHVSVTDNATLNGAFDYVVSDHNNATNQMTVAILNQPATDPDLTGTTAHEIIVARFTAHIDGGGGNDLIFGSDEDDTIVFHEGDIVQAGADTSFPDSLDIRGDVLAIDHDVDLTKLDLSKFSGIETISLLEAGYGAGTAQSLTLDASDVISLSTHSIKYGNGQAAIRIDLEAVDQLYLSITKTGDGWSQFAFGPNQVIYAHQTTLGDQSTADAFVVINTPYTPHAGQPPANVHLGQDAA